MDAGAWMLLVGSVTALAAGLALAAVAVRDRRRSWLDDAMRRRLLVHTRDGQTLDGLLVRVEARGVVLGPATLADGPHDLDGEVWVPRERVAWVQKPTPRDDG